MTEHKDIPADEIDRSSLPCGWMRYGIMGFGFLCTGLGIAGFFLPVMPSTIFLLIALWAFSKSSIRFHNWLYFHPRYGRTVRAWHKDKSIPIEAKWAAVSMMAMSVLIVAVFVANSWVLPVSIAAILTPIAAYIVTRPTLTSTP